MTVRPISGRDHDQSLRRIRTRMNYANHGLSERSHEKGFLGLSQSTESVNP